MGKTESTTMKEGKERYKSGVIPYKNLAGERGHGLDLRAAGGGQESRRLRHRPRRGCLVVAGSLPKRVGFPCQRSDAIRLHVTVRMLF